MLCVPCRRHPCRGAHCKGAALVPPTSRDVMGLLSVQYLQAEDEGNFSMGRLGGFPSWHMRKGPGWWGSTPHCPLSSVLLQQRDVGGCPHEATKRAATKCWCLQKGRRSSAFLHHLPRQSPPPPARQTSGGRGGVGPLSAGCLLCSLSLVLRGHGAHTRAHARTRTHASGQSGLSLMKSSRWV